MPNCNRCGAPIIFLRERKDYVITGSYHNPKEVITDPKMKPIDVNPSPNGTVAIYETKTLFCGEMGTFISARMHPETAKRFRNLGGTLYTIHFDTCPNRR